MNKPELMKAANEIRKGAVTGVFHAKSGHPGGSLSAADLLTYLYFEEMNIDPKDPRKQTEIVSFYQKVISHQVYIQHLHREDFSRLKI